ncbi:hypothetical protein MTR67_043360 [Solanum verrucosum]|uniref:Reverse transcriptase zinc-binding domain-containing protein n=1 Tax=Solanum verrucosum TaxID=315347 RepID=A0AAF0UNY1_SOLVR|nr:hypothetical protein MTR67_043360 [Solanum verrucosum]
MIQQNSEENRTTLHGLNDEYIKFMKLEEAILRQKTESQWFNEGDANSKYFHALIRGRRRRFFIHKILKDDDEWIQGDEQNAEAACEHFQDIGARQSSIIDEKPLNCIPKMVTQAQNDELQAITTVELELAFWVRCVCLSSISNGGCFGPNKLCGATSSRKSIVKDLIRKIRSGTYSFWWDNWLGVGPLVHYSTDSNRFNTATISDFMVNGQWDIERVIQQAPPTHVPSILATQLHLQHGLPDLPIQSLTTNGEFSCSSAWNEIRQKETKTKINTSTSHKNNLFKCSFFLWSAIRSKLPTNEKISSFGEEPSDRYCYNNPGMDTIEHTLYYGKFP